MAFYKFILVYLGKSLAGMETKSEIRVEIGKYNMAKMWVKVILSLVGVVLRVSLVSSFLAVDRLF